MIITFYSYKGGVGRSQLAANLAAYLYHYEQRRILIIDWDLEAPGIELFFLNDKSKRDEKRKNLKNGLIDLLNQYILKIKTGETIPEEQLPYFDENYINTIWKEGENKGTIDLITAVKYDDDFFKKINEFDWFEFYEDFQGKVYMEFLKDKLNSLDYDYIFIDSRTGVSDYSGICNIQMPQLNVIVAAPTYQNVEGIYSVCKSIYESPYVKSGQYRPSWVMPILSRLDTQDNQGVAHWMAYFREKFANYIADFLKAVNPNQDVNESLVSTFISSTRLDYKTELSYGETIVFKDNNRQRFEDGTLERQFFNIARIIESLANQKSNTPEYNYYNPSEPITFITKYSQPLPKFLNNVPSTSSSFFFIGRKEEIVLIKKILNNSGALVINGLAGVGKTALLRRHLEENNNDYQHVIYIKTPTVIGDETAQAEAFLRSFVQDSSLTANLSFNYNQDLNLIENFNNLINKLNQIEAKSLLLIDNASAILENYKKHLPSGKNWHILITSREIIDDFPSINIEKLADNDAKELFYHSYLLKKDDKNLSSILKIIDNNPFQIVAIASEAQNSHITIENAKDALKQSGTPYTIPIEGINEYELRILRYFSIIPDEEYSPESLRSFFNIIPQETRFFQSNLQNLTKKGWLIQGKQGYRCHRIIQNSVRKQATPNSENCYEPIRALINLLVIDDEDGDNYNAKQPFIPIAESILHHISQRNEDIVTLMNNLATVYFGLGDNKKSLVLLQEALAIREDILDANHPSLAASYNNIAVAYNNMDRFEESIKYLQKAIIIQERILKYDNPVLATAYSNLAMTYFISNKYEEATQYIEKALDVFGDDIEEDNPNYQTALNLKQAISKKSYSKNRKMK